MHQILNQLLYPNHVFLRNAILRQSFRIVGGMYHYLGDMTWLSLLFVNLLHALSPHHLEKFGAALKRKAFHYVGSGHIQHVFVYLSLKSINKNTLLNVFINFLANTGENLKNK